MFYVSPIKKKKNLTEIQGISVNWISVWLYETDCIIYELLKFVKVDQKMIIHVIQLLRAVSREHDKIKTCIMKGRHTPKIGYLKWSDN